MNTKIDGIIDLYPPVKEQKRVLKALKFYDLMRTLRPSLVHLLARRELENLRIEELALCPCRGNNLVVSLTSYPPRIPTLHLTVRCLLNQSLKPDRLVLYLAEEDFPKGKRDLPFELLELQEAGLEIRWCDNHRSFDKLIHAIKDFPESLIVTADDDLYYPTYWLERLFLSHQNYPGDLSAHRAHRVALDARGQIMPYARWPRCVESGKARFAHFATTGGGVLYPPGALHRDVLRSDLFLALCPKADDIWFWAMAVLNGKKFRVCDGNVMDVIAIPSSQGVSLFSTNRNENDPQLKAVALHYPQLREILIREADL